MTRLAVDLAADGEAAYACPRCARPAGLHCVTASGKRASRAHVARWGPLADAFARGYERGEHAAAEVTWYDLVSQHRVVSVATLDGIACSCGAQCPDNDGGHPGHIVDVMHDHGMVVARLA